jgi:hypothetical protein
VEPTTVPTEEGDQRGTFDETLNLRTGEYTLLGLLAEVERSSGKRVHWLPQVGATPGRALKLAHTNQLHVGDVSTPDNQQAIRLRPDLELGEALGAALALATEFGLCSRPPDREVWTAMIVEGEILLVMLPGAF